MRVFIWQIGEFEPEFILCYRKSPGGVFLTLVKKIATKEERDVIFEFDRQKKSLNKKEQKKRKRRLKKTQECAATTAESNTCEDILLLQ